MEVGGNVLGHREGEGGLTHGRAPGDDDEVGVLPAAGHVVELVVARGDAGESVGVGGCSLDDLQRLIDDGVDLGVVLLHVALGEFEERAFGLLHEFLDIDSLVEGLGLDDARERDELSGQRLLGDNLSVILDVGRRGDLGTEFGDIARATHLLEVARLGQLFGDGKHIDGALVHVEVADGRVDHLMTGIIEALGMENLADDGVSVFVDHQGTEHSVLYIECLWR